MLTYSRKGDVNNICLDHYAVNMSRKDIFLKLTRL